MFYPSIRSVIRVNGFGGELRRNFRRRPGSQGDENDDGFTLLELLVVLGILVLIATIAAPQVLRYLGGAKTEVAKAQISAIATALELYALDSGGYPADEIGLKALVAAPNGQPRWKGPYITRASGVIDPWGQPYRYRRVGRGGRPDIFTLGRDNAAGGTGEDQDVTN